MKDTAPISLGILAVAAIFGLIGGGVAFVLYEFGIAASVMIAILVALIVMLILWLGWRDPAPTLQESNAAGRAELEAARVAGAPSADTSAMATTAADSAGAVSASAAANAGTAASVSAAEESPAAAARAAKAAAEAKAAEAAAAAKADEDAAKAAADADAAKAKAAADAEAAKAAADAKAAEAKTAADAKAAEADAGDKDYDGDGVVEGTNEGKRPEALKGPRDGKADNLKEIKGIGPKMEKMCNGLGFYHFDQIAKWTPDEVAWVDANLEGFKGRVTRDTWVAQAKILAAGGDTEFSKRVEDGDVY